MTIKSISSTKKTKILFACYAAKQRNKIRLHPSHPCHPCAQLLPVHQLMRLFYHPHYKHTLYMPHIINVT
jgi:hypothetical protein